MSANSAIQWTDHTFNPWSGCTKLSAGCAHCYAAALPPSMRRGAEWGEGRDRVPASDSYWRQPLAWDRAAAKAGERHRVFCASVADVFEDRDDLDPWRERLFALIRATPNLDWLLLTKRPERMARWAREDAAGVVLGPVRSDSLHGEVQSAVRLSGLPWPENAWAGTSVEDQAAADARIPYLLQVPARVRFLSMEPLLGAVDLDKLWCHNCETDEHVRFDPPSQPWCIECDSEVGGAGWLDPLADERQRGVSWVIVGGESGHRARPLHPEWVRSLRDQCVAAGVPFFFKQWGEFAPEDRPDVLAEAASLDLHLPGMVRRLGKHVAGRLLDGREWNELPTAGGAR